MCLLCRLFLSPACFVGHPKTQLAFKTFSPPILFPQQRLIRVLRQHVVTCYKVEQTDISPQGALTSLYETTTT